jgi:hypothetical protein
MWNPQRLKNLMASTVCYSDSFKFFNKIKETNNKFDISFMTLDNFIRMHANNICSPEKVSAVKAAEIFLYYLLI